MASKLYRDKRLIIHYVQPYYPYLTLATKGIKVDELKRIKKGAEMVKKLLDLYEASILRVDSSEFLLGVAISPRPVGDKNLREGRNGEKLLARFGEAYTHLLSKKYN